MTLSEFRHVRSRIQPHIRTTPIVPSEVSNLYLKLGATDGHVTQVVKGDIAAGDEVVTDVKAPQGKE